MTLSRCTLYLSERGLDPEVARDRYSVELDTKIDREKIVSRLGADIVLNGAGLLSKCAKELLWFPVTDRGRNVVQWICRPCPTIDQKRKFLCPVGSSGAPFIPQSVYSSKESQPLIITEGPVKAIVCNEAGVPAVGLNGVWCASAPGASGKYILRHELSQWLRLRGRKVYIGFDADAAIKPEVRRAMFRLWLLLVAAQAEVSQLTSWDVTEAKGIDDLLSARSNGEEVIPAQKLSMLINDAAPMIETIKATPLDLGIFQGELAKVEMDGLLRDQLCKALAPRLGVQVDGLRAIVREQATENDPFADLEPWDELVDGNQLFTELAGLFKKHVIMDGKYVTAAVLWCVSTYLSDKDIFPAHPYLGILSPVKRCGKTRLLSLLHRLTLRPLSSVGVTAATIYRAIQKWHPTFLIDEIDTLKDNSGKIDPQLVGILNAGFDGDARVPRCNENNEVEMFDVRCPKALAAIGKLPETWADRSIVVNLRRKLKEEKVAPLRKTSREVFETFRRKIVHWILDNAHLVKSYLDDDSILPPGMNDRADDAWLVLLAIAKAAGEDWLLKAQIAATNLSGDAAEDDDDSVKTVLLLKLRTLFKERIMADRVGMSFEELSQTEEAGDHHIETEDILKVLNADKEAPWADWRNGEGLTAEKLKVLLKPYGVKPDKPPTRAQRKKLGRGHNFESLREVFARYLRTEKPSSEEDENQPF